MRLDHLLSKERTGELRFIQSPIEDKRSSGVSSLTWNIDYLAPSNCVNNEYVPSGNGNLLTGRKVPGTLLGPEGSGDRLS